MNNSAPISQKTDGKPKLSKLPDLNPGKAERLSKLVPQPAGQPSGTFDQDKYVRAWSNPAMHDVRHGLTADQLAKLKSAVNPNGPNAATLQTLNTPVQAGLTDALNKLCADPISDEVQRYTFSEGTRRSGGFIMQRFLKTGEEVPSNVLDAFGHCFNGCEVAKQCGPSTAVVLGREYEAWREAGWGGDHDSFVQDVHNQGRGVLLYLNKGESVDCKAECAAAVDYLLDLSAPQARIWNCSVHVMPNPVTKALEEIYSCGSREP